MSAEHEVIRAELERLAQENGGKLTADIVWQSAKAKDSPLHDRFEWDVRKAAIEHWRDTARRIIASVRIVVTTETRTLEAPMYVRDPEMPANKQGFTSLPRLRTDADLARQAIAAEFQRAESALDRAVAISAALGMQDEVQEAAITVRALRERVSAGLLTPQ